MIVKIDSGNKGWSNYAINGTSKKTRDKTKIKLIDGDLEVGDMICDNTSYDSKYYRIVLAFRGKPSEDKMRSAYEEWKTQFFLGFDEEEYHCDCVLHKDTDDYHLHVRIPKLNLLTNTQLVLYHHDSELKRKDLIQQYIDLKYELESPHDNKSIINDQSYLHINEWRKAYGQELLDFSKKAKRTKAINAIHDYLIDVHKEGVLNSYSDIKKVLQELQLNVVNEGFDQGKGFHYITVENESGKVRITGELFDPDGRFWEHSRSKQSIELIGNKLQKQTVDREAQLNIIKKELDEENEKRLEFVQKRYGSARKRAREKIINIKNRPYQQKEIDDERVRSINGVITRVRTERQKQQDTARALAKTGDGVYQQVRSDLKRDSRLLKYRGYFRRQWRQYSKIFAEFAEQFRERVTTLKGLLTRMKDKSPGEITR